MLRLVERKFKHPSCFWLVKVALGLGLIAACATNTYPKQFELSNFSKCNTTSIIYVVWIGLLGCLHHRIGERKTPQNQASEGSGIVQNIVHLQYNLRGLSGMAPYWFNLFAATCINIQKPVKLYVGLHDGTPNGNELSSCPIGQPEKVLCKQVSPKPVFKSMNM